jgi:hypothetical protein
MSEIPENLAEMIDEVRQSRDELRVQIHLAATEVKDDWQELEKKWEHFSAHMEKVGDATGEAAGDVGEALTLVGAELRSGYHRIRNAL